MHEGIDLEKALDACFHSLVNPVPPSAQTTLRTTAVGKFDSSQTSPAARPRHALAPGFGPGPGECMTTVPAHAGRRDGLSMPIHVITHPSRLLLPDAAVKVGLGQQRCSSCVGTAGAVDSRRELVVANAKSRSRDVPGGRRLFGELNCECFPLFGGRRSHPGCCPSRRAVQASPSCVLHRRQALRRQRSSSRPPSRPAWCVSKSTCNDAIPCDRNC